MNKPNREILTVSSNLQQKSNTQVLLIRLPYLKRQCYAGLYPSTRSIKTEEIVKGGEKISLFAAHESWYRLPGLLISDLDAAEAIIDVENDLQSVTAANVRRSDVLFPQT